METQTKALLVLGGVAILGGTAYVLTRPEKPKKKKEALSPGLPPGPLSVPGQGLPGMATVVPGKLGWFASVVPGSLPMAKTPAGVTLGPVWTETKGAEIKSRANTSWLSRDKPAFSYANVVKVASDAASDVWPKVTWPKNVQQSDALIANKGSSWQIWSKVLNIAISVFPDAQRSGRPVPNASGHKAGYNKKLMDNLETIAAYFERLGYPINRQGVDTPRGWTEFIRLGWPLSIKSIEGFQKDWNEVVAAIDARSITPTPKMSGLQGLLDLDGAVFAEGIGSSSLTPNAKSTLNAIEAAVKYDGDMTGAWSELVAQAE